MFYLKEIFFPSVQFLFHYKGTLFTRKVRLYQTIKQFVILISFNIKFYLETFMIGINKLKTYIGKKLLTCRVN